MDIQEATSLLLLGNRAREKRGRRKRKKRVEVQGQQQQNQQQQQGSLDLVQMNRAVESLIMDDPPNQPQDFTRVLPPSIWEEWLWRSNPNDPPTSDALLNRNHLLGFLICRYRAATQPPCTDRITLSPQRLVVVQDKPPAHMTLRELRDTITNIMLLWSKDIHGGKECSTDPLLAFMDACFHRLGELSWATWPCGDRSSPISDDVGSIEQVRVNGNDHDQVALSCIRSLLCSFMVAYRLIHWMRVSTVENMQPLGDGPPHASPIHQHHVNASLDEFYRLAMYYDLPPAARLNYRHMFSGLYNCISQPVYYHNPDYERRIQLPLHAVQIYPEVSVIYDDDNFDKDLPQSVSDLSSNERRYAFRWLITSGRVYLFRWDPKNHTHVVYREADGNIINCLRRNYLPHRAAGFQKMDAGRRIA